MKTINRIYNLNNTNYFVLFADESIETNPTVASMYKTLNDDSVVLISLNFFNETNTFFTQNIHFETIKSTPHIDGYITDQIFDEHYHHINESFLNELSNYIQNQHLIIGPSFSIAPSFLHAKNLDIAIKHNVTAVMFDTRHLNFKNYKDLQPLAKLKSYSRKRIDIIPVVDSKEKRDELLSLIPFDIVCIL